MRKTAYGTVKVRAIAGTYVIFLAFHMKQADATGLMGFAIQRTRLSDCEVVWLRGNKRFPSVSAPSGWEDANSHLHPFQAFQWADYTAEPGERYRYRVIPMSGPPGALIEGPATSVTIDTEPLAGTSHDVHWNRGAIASQAFARRYPNMTLDQAGPPAYAWLTRDLLPGLLAFIGQASDATYSLRAAIYELQWPEVLAAFGAAAAAGADVSIVYHADPDPNDTTTPANDAAIDQAGIRPLVKRRTRAKLMHDKFIVLSRNGDPRSVWTGSTNVSRNALFGQLNVGHAIHDQGVAAAFLTYWDALVDDLELDAMKDRVEAINLDPTGPVTAALTPIFSPRHGRAVFDWWIAQASQSKPLFMTFPFGIVKDFRPVFDTSDGILRFALLDKYVNGGTAASRAAAIADIERIRRHPNIGMALGNHIFVDWIDGWRKEPDGIGLHVDWIHTKFMLIDPLGPHPVTLSGSANWSEASVTDNDENVLVVRDDKRVADIYFGEFMRLFAHHRFRESVQRHIEDAGLVGASDAVIAEAAKKWRPKDLFEDWTKWVPDHFAAGSEHDIARRYFAPQLKDRDEVPATVERLDPTTKAQVEAVVRLVHDVFGDAVLGAYLFGSAVRGGLRSDSDLDILVVAGRRTSDAERGALIDGLLSLSRSPVRPELRPLEVTVVAEPDLRPWRYPPLMELQYGDWWRRAFESGDLAPWTSPNADLAVILTSARADGVPLFGPPAAELLDPVPRADLERAMRDEIPELLPGLEADDTRNSLLTLARIWYTLETGTIESKDVAAARALERLHAGAGEALALARGAYLGDAVDTWDPAARARARTDWDAMLEAIDRART